MLLILSVIVVAAGVVLAWFMYLATPVRPASDRSPRTPVHALLLNAYYVDGLYDRPSCGRSSLLSGFLARVSISGSSTAS